MVWPLTPWPPFLAWAPDFLTSLSQVVSGTKQLLQDLTKSSAPIPPLIPTLTPLLLTLDSTEPTSPQGLLQCLLPVYHSLVSLLLILPLKLTASFPQARWADTSELPFLVRGAYSVPCSVAQSDAWLAIMATKTQSLRLINWEFWANQLKAGKYIQL